MGELAISAVVDASAVLAWIYDEKGADTVEKVLSVAGISAVNFAEVLHIASQRGFDPDDLEGDLATYGLALIPFGGSEARLIPSIRRAEVKVGLSLSMADRCCLATAMVAGVPAVMSDNAWEELDLPVDIQPFR